MRTLRRPLWAVVLSQVPSAVVDQDSNSHPVGRPPGEKAPPSNPAFGIRFAGARHKGAARAEPSRPTASSAVESRRGAGGTERTEERMTTSCSTGVTVPLRKVILCTFPRTSIELKQFVRTDSVRPSGRSGCCRSGPPAKPSARSAVEIRRRAGTGWVFGVRMTGSCATGVAALRQKPSCAGESAGHLIRNNSFQ
jgi:hypothetical protein